MTEQELWHWAAKHYVSFEMAKRIYLARINRVWKDYPDATLKENEERYHLDFNYESPATNEFLMKLNDSKITATTINAAAITTKHVVLNAVTGIDWRAYDIFRRGG